MLGSMHVQYLVLPAMKPVVSMWRRSFGFVPLDLEEYRAIEDRRDWAAHPSCCAELTRSSLLGTRTCSEGFPGVVCKLRLISRWLANTCLWLSAPRSRRIVLPDSSSAQLLKSKVAATVSVAQAAAPRARNPRTETRRPQGACRDSGSDA